MQPYYDDGQITLYCGAAEDVLPSLPAQSADMVFTDPPYLTEFIECYRTLAVESTRLLQSGAFVYAYTGAHVLPSVLQRMSPPLEWFWLFTLRHCGGAPRMWSRRLMVMSKPILVLTNGYVRPQDLAWCGTEADSSAPSKEYHQWGQSIESARKHIALRTKPGAVILDPFAGGGTTVRAAKDTGRRCIAVELKEAHCETIVKRLAQQVLPLDLGA